MGQRAGVKNAALAYAAELAAIRFNQDRHSDLEPAVLQFAQMYPAVGLWELVLVWIHINMRKPRPEIEARFQQVAAGGVAALPRDQLWLVRMSLFTDACLFLHDEARAAEAYAEAAFLNGRPEQALIQLETLKKRGDLDYVTRSRVDARIAAITPTVLELRQQGIRDPDMERR